MGLKTRPDVILGSDGAGVVRKVGGDFNSFQAGDRVVTHLAPRFYNDASLGVLDDDALPRMGHICAGLGQEVDGTLTTHGVFHESCLIKFGDCLGFEEAATLSCSGITAWNGLMGLHGREVKKGDWVLVQGSGGVSVAALQFALAAGASVVATTSSDEKGAKLRELGASHVINYREVLEWGSVAKQLTPSGRGVDIVVDVGGNATLTQSLRSIRTDGLVVMAGMVGKSDEQVPMLSLMGSNCMVRSVLLGTKQMFRDMVTFIEEMGVKPALDTETFGLGKVKEALKRLEEQKHFSKIVIQIPGKH